MKFNHLITNLLNIFILFSCNYADYSNKNLSGEIQGARQSGREISEIFEIPDISARAFLYHRFSENKYPSTSISGELFEKHLIYLTEQRIPVITLSDFLALDSVPETGECVILTIDDAFRSFYQHGFPLLKKYGFKATLFVNTATVGGGDYSGWDELREMSEYGIEIGNHTHSHTYFLNEPEGTRFELLGKEVEMAQQIFRERLGIECRVFSFPFGEYDTGMQHVIRELGFAAAVAQHSGVISRYSDPFALPRFPMTDQYGQMSSFIEKVKMQALPVVEIKPPVTVPDKNPPVLNVRFTDPGLDLSRLQAFFQGGKGSVRVVEGDTVMVEMAASGTISSRRILYTITVPHKTSGKWYWFSHQWVFPDVP
jgi:peptidoglycan/xylan/chitin deacetylase (PgdA/CDA1 family)